MVTESFESRDKRRKIGSQRVDIFSRLEPRLPGGGKFAVSSGYLQVTKGTCSRRRIEVADDTLHLVRGCHEADELSLEACSIMVPKG